MDEEDLLVTPLSLGPPKPPVYWDPSPNFASRMGHTIDTIVLHNTDGSLAGAINRFLTPAAQVSAHYIVDRDGQITQMVHDADTAWHSGNKPVNQKSIGIEIVADATNLGMTHAQEESLVALIEYLLGAYGITTIVPHRSIHATACPGWVWPTNKDLDDWKLSKEIHV
jgi:N-acetylmuramoyl-L-alanine amidase